MNLLARHRYGQYPGDHYHLLCQLERTMRCVSVEREVDDD